MKSFWIASTGLNVQEKKLDLIANNLANINTSGYKFEDAIVEEINSLIDNDNVIKRIGDGTNIVAINKNFSQGLMESTGLPFDIAINGDGFFEVLLPDDSIGYVRSGEFTIDANGQLVTESGYKLYPEIFIPENTVAVSISDNGLISVRLDDGSVKDIGTIELAKFINPNGLKSVGTGIYIKTENSGEPIVDAPGKQGIGTLMQGFIERSNVNMANEMIKMMITQKSYEINARVIQTADQMMSIANNIKR